MFDANHRGAAQRADNRAVPAVSLWLQRGFHAFLARFLRRHFHTLAAAGDTAAVANIDRHLPLIVYGNHPSWWDPLVAHFVCRRSFAPRQFFAPIDADALRRYQVLSKLGFYGVSLGTARGAADFLRISEAILASSGTSIWMTPEGRFADPRDRAAAFAPGLAHLCLRMRRGVIVPMAIEYPFWEERLPECLVYFGQPIHADGHPGLDKSTWSDLLSTRLRAAQDQLARLVIARQAEAFEPLLHGGRGAGGWYDQLRRMRSRLSGTPFQPQHGEKFR